MRCVSGRDTSAFPLFITDARIHAFTLSITLRRAVLMRCMIAQRFTDIGLWNSGRHATLDASFLPDAFTLQPCHIYYAWSAFFITTLLLLYILSPPMLYFAFFCQRRCHAAMLPRGFDVLCVLPHLRLYGAPHWRLMLMTASVTPLPPTRCVADISFFVISRDAMLHHSSCVMTALPLRRYEFHAQICCHAVCPPLFEPAVCPADSALRHRCWCCQRCFW